MNVTNEWTTVHEAWTNFNTTNPALGYTDGIWQVHNFLRLFRAELMACDAIRKARGRHWIAHRDRFPAAAFECATSYGKRTSAKA
jgi:hypothetical protein